MQVEQLLVRELSQIPSAWLERVADDPLLAHLLADYQTLEVRLAAHEDPSSLEYQALDEELQTLKGGLIQHFQPRSSTCCGRCQKASCSD